MAIEGTIIFNSPYDQYKGRNGQSCVIIKTIDRPDDTHDAEVLPMYIIEFGDEETIEAWPEELGLV